MILAGGDIILWRRRFNEEGGEGLLKVRYNTKGNFNE